MINLRAAFERVTGTGRAGRSEADTATMWTTPYAWRTSDGVYVGHNGEVWMYRTVRLSPMKWEDAEQQLTLAAPLARLLGDLGGTSRQPMGGLATLSNNRVVHLISITWDDLVTPPRENSEELRTYQAGAFGFLAPKRVLFVGVQLRSSLRGRAGRGGGSGGSVLKAVTELVKESVIDEVPDLANYAKDKEHISAIFDRADAQPPTRQELDQLESWYNLGRGPDAVIEELPTRLAVTGIGEIEMAAVMSFDHPVMPSPQAQWALDAISHPGDAPHVISVRAELEPPNLTRARARRAQRRIMSNMEEERKTQDLEKVELSETFQQAKEVEDYLAGSNQPMLANCSLIMAREVGDATQTYMEFLEQQYGIQMKALEHRQIQALEETLPCSSIRVNPFLQDLNVPMVSHAGLQSFSDLGDDAGVFGGLIDPDGTPFFVDPLGAPRKNLPPVFGIFGDPGSGKTFFAQSMATQSALNGLPVIFVNPKGGDSLYGMVDYVQSLGISAGRISMSALEESPGAFDPFRYAPPTIAAEIANVHILSALDDSRDGLSLSERLALGSGLKRGALNGARCVWDALKYVPGEDAERVRSLVEQQMEASSMFSLGIALKPLPRLDVSQRLTLVDFDRDLGLPEGKTPSEYSVSERIALAAVRLVIRASLEILIANRSGVLIVDEAWTFLSQAEGLASLQRISREGRSLNILPVFLTQRIADVVTKDLESYLSRVLVLKLNEKKEAETALGLCGLQPTSQRLAQVREFGPLPPEDGRPARWARGIFRDLAGRHAQVVLGPTPPDAAEAYSTNPEDRRRREERRIAREQAERAEYEAVVAAAADGEAAPAAPPTPAPAPATPAPAPAGEWNDTWFAG
ncbi:ATP-binding protein [Actinomadura violacea]|uniref:ATP-binding protein n=1 Tax=Actinomadura violacea TaxID=2819934 RepID=A0ABS3S8K2_9ACTN|nr:ATP-binding protein [Actinomadura violacea]MBO2465327.1 ATP-binding protein [Actinomadura violacea]